MKFLSDILAKAGLTVDGVVTLNNTATGQTPAANDNSTKLATTAWVRTFVQPYSLPIASASILGGIKVGTGLSIDSGTGILSVTGGSASSLKSTQTFVVTEGQTVFTVTNGYAPGLIDIFLNGVYLSPNQSTATNGSTFTLNDPAATGDIIDVIVVSPVYQGTSTTTDQLPEGVVNLYYTNARARAAITLTVNGSSGASTYSSSTGVLNVPTYTLAGLGGIGGSGTTGYVSKFTNSTTIGNSLIYDDGFGIGINTSSPYNTSFYSLDINGALLVKNVGKAANITLINADPAGGGNNAFVIHTVGGTLTSSYVDIQGYYGASVTGSTTIRLNAAGGNLLVGSLIGTGTRMVVASSTGILSTQDIVTYVSQVKHQVKSAQVITKGQAVYVSSADGTNMIVSKASNATEGTSSKTMGLLDASVSINGFANVVTEGLLAGLNTASANAGDPVWLGTDGNLIYGLLNKPSAPAHLVFIGIVTRANANNGEIFVKVQNGFELDELHDLSVKNPSDGDMIKYVASTGLWTKVAASTTNIVEGTNLYYTDARVGTYLTNNSYATQSYVNTAVSNLVDAAPGTLDTLNELAAALGDDPNFATTVATSIGTKEPIITAGTTSQYWRGDKTWQTLPIYTLSGLGGQPQLNGTGFVKVSGTTVSYDNSTYYLASNPSGYITGISFANVSAKPTTIAGYGITDSLVYTTSTYSNPSWITALAWSKITGAPAFITGYTETDTLSSVTGRGSTTSTSITLKSATTAASLGGFSIMGAGEFMSTGSLAGYFFENRSGGTVTSSSNWYGWYATSAIVRLFNGSTDIVSINGISGAITAGSFIKSGGTSSQFLMGDGSVSTNPGWITGYSEIDTLNSVTSRGASTANNITLSGGGNLFNGHHYFSAYDANGNHYPHYNAGSNANGSKLNLRMFDNSGNVVLFHLNGSTKAIEWNGNTVYHSGNLTNLNQLSNGPGYITSSSGITGAAGKLSSRDIRTIAPNSENAAELRFGFTSWANNNSAPYADYLHLRSYSDSSGGSDNLVMFLKSGIGMRIWQQSWNSGTAYSSYVDVYHSGNLTNLNQLTNGPGYITGESDTLASVTGRGATTSTAISINNTLTVTNGRIIARTGGVNTYGIFSGYDNSNHLIVFRAMIGGTDTSPTFTAGHQTCLVEYAEANDTTGWFFKTAQTGNYAEVARITRTGITWNGNTVIHAGNIGSYTAGAANSVAWGNVSSKPGDIMYYAGFTLDADTMPSNSTGFTYSVNAPLTGPIVKFSTGGGYDLQINAPYYWGNEMYFRVRNGDLGVWRSWKQVLNAESHSYAANMNQYVRTSDNVAFNALSLPDGGRIIVNGETDTWGIRFRNTVSTSNLGGQLKNIIWTGGGALEGLAISGVGTGGAAFEIQNNGNAWAKNNMHAQNLFATAAAGRIQAGNSSTDGMLYDSSRAALVARGAYPHIELWSDVANDNHGGTLRFGGYDNGSSGAFKSWHIGTPGQNLYFMDIGYGGTSNSNPHAGIAGLGASYGYAAAFTMMRFHNNGNIGIGNFGTYGSLGDNTPAYKLDIRGNISVRSTTASGTWGYAGTFIDTTSAANNYVPFNFVNQYGDHSWGIVARFHIATSGQDKPAIQFTSAGSNDRWSIGYCTGSDFNFRITQNQGYRTDNSTNDGWGTERFRINTDGNTYCFSNFTASGDVTAYSDIRVKTDIQTLTDPIEKIKSIRGVTFKRNDTDDKDRKHLGVVAQEVMDVLPEVISETDKGLFTVAYGNMAGLFIEAIKEQQVQIESQKTEIEELKDLVKQLINR